MRTEIFRWSPFGLGKDSRAEPANDWVGLLVDVAVGAALGAGAFTVGSPACLTTAREATDPLVGLALGTIASGIYLFFTGNRYSGIAGLVGALGAYLLCAA